MKPDLRFSKCFDELVAIQSKHNLESRQIEGVYIWRLVRGQIFNSILEERGIFLKGEAKTLSLKVRVWNKMRQVLKTFIEPNGFRILLKRTISNLKKAGITLVRYGTWINSNRLLNSTDTYPSVVIAFPRLMGGTHRLTKTVEKKLNSPFLLLDKPTTNIFSRNRLDPKFIDFKLKKRPVKEPQPELEAFSNQIASLFRLEPKKVSQIVKKAFFEFRLYENFFLELYKNKNVQTVYLCWNRFYFAALSAAQKCELKSVELQHGFIAPNHIQYSWSGFDVVPYFPDYFLTFGEFWADTTKLPLSCTTKVIGSSHLWEKASAYSNTVKEENLVIVFSQKIIGVELLKFTSKVAMLRPDLHFKIKLHPAERYQDLFYYIDGGQPDNLTVCEEAEDTYELMARATFQLGVSSTTLIEGMVFSNRTFVVPLPSWQYMQPAIERQDAFLVQDPAHAAELLQFDTPFCNDSSRYFAEPNSSNIPMPEPSAS